MNKKLKKDLAFENEIAISGILYESLDPSGVKRVAERLLQRLEQFKDKMPAFASQIEKHTQKAQEAVESATGKIANHSPTRAPTQESRTKQRRITTKTVTRNFASKLGGMLSSPASAATVPEERKDNTSETASPAPNTLKGVIGGFLTPKAVPEDKNE